MSHQDYDKNYRENYTESGINPFSPLIIGAIAVIVALVAFLAFSENSGMQQAEYNTNPPVTTTPAPAEKGPSVVPSTPPATEPKQQ